MKYDGYNYTKNKTIIPLPQSYSEKQGKPNYVFFGKKCKKDAIGAVPAGYYVNGEYAIPLPCNGHSLTNLMYCGDYSILLLDMVVYTRFTRCK